MLAGIGIATLAAAACDDVQSGSPLREEGAVKCIFAVVLTVLVAAPVQAQLAAPNDLGVSFGHVHLHVADAEIHERLWTALFDGVLVEREGYVAVRVPGALVFLTESEPTAPSRTTAMDHIGLAVRNLRTVLAEWRALGYEVEREFVDSTGAAAAYITLPDGVRLELREDVELPVAAEMGHVHFITPRARELLAWYADVFGATPRSGGSAETTTAVPGSGLSFGDPGEERSATHGAAIDHIGFEVQDIHEFAERLKSKGVTFDVEPFYIEGLDLWVGFFTDAAGVRVEVTEGLDGY